MKINGNRNNNSRVKADESKTDQLTKKAVEVVDEIPVKNFDPDQTWLKISARLGQLDKGFVTWGLAMAASFSLLIAANLSKPDWNLFRTKTTPMQQTQDILVQSVIKKEGMKEQADKWFKNRDKDGDGKLSFEEFEAGRNQKKKAD